MEYVKAGNGDRAHWAMPIGHSMQRYACEHAFIENYSKSTVDAAISVSIETVGAN